jgi:hypothetical protein
MQLIKTDLTSLLTLCASCLFVFLVGCSSAPTKDPEKPVIAMPGNALSSTNSVSEGSCKIEDETGVKVCITPLKPAMNCRKSPDQSIYKACQVEVSYDIENESERPVRVKAECQAGFEYKGRYGWKGNSKTDSYSYTLSPKETKSRTFYLDSKFNRNRKVKEIVMGPVECSIISVLSSDPASSTDPVSSANDVSIGDCKIEGLTGVKVCVKALEPLLNCKKSTNQSIYKTCQLEVSYDIENESERSASVAVECQAGFEYMAKQAWQVNSKTDSYNYTLSPKETASRKFGTELKFNWPKKVTEVKMGSVDCVITSVYVY